MFVPLPAAGAGPDAVGERSVPVSAVPTLVPAPTATDASAGHRPVTWPSPSSATVDLAAGAGVMVGSGVSVGRPSSDGLPGRIDAVGVAGPPGRVQVDVLDHATAERAGAAVIVRLRQLDQPVGDTAAEVKIDYSGFGSSYGADWGARLRLVQLPACAAVTPELASCRSGTPLPAHNDAGAQRVAGDVALAPSAPAAADRHGTARSLDAGQQLAEPTVVGLLAGGASDAGTFAATPLSPTSSWQAGTSGGEFTWSYPVRVPPAPSSLVPSLSVGYSSAAVDGRTAGANGQPSWLGEGFDYQPGFVERSYATCADDNAYERDMKLFTSNGTGTLSGSSSLVDSRWDVSTVVFSPGDFTGDGKPDVLYRSENDTHFYLRRGNGSGGFAGAAERIGIFWANSDSVFSPGDFNGDGKPDLLYRRISDQNLYMIKGNGAGGFLDGGASYQVGTDWSSAELITSVGDFSGDGKPDVMFRNVVDKHLYMHRGTGTGSFQSGAPIQIGTFWGGVDQILGRGDFTGDGKTDVLYRNGPDQKIYMLRGNGAGTWLTGVNELVGTATAAPGRVFWAGDFSGDGKADLLGTADTVYTPKYPNGTRDRCWRASNARISFGSRSAELVRDDATGAWRLAGDDGSRIELMTDTVNEDNDHEYWKLTTSDGTQYFFGRNRLPNWATGRAETGSVLTEAVFANHAGEPCFNAASFASSFCRQAWRWNLDYVVDVHGNSMSYWYTKETNLTGLAGDASTTTSYDRAGVLARIDYGTRTEAEYTTTAPNQVVFTSGMRCLGACGTLETPTAASWPDTPWDLRCTAAPCTNNLAPSFWTHSRLLAVTTRVWGGSSYRDVDEWAFSHTFPDPTDTTSAVLWLSDIVHTGKVGGTTVLPPVHFGSSTPTPNRADHVAGTGVPVKKFRLTTIDTGTGGQVLVTYDATDCSSSALPDPDNNTKRCFPQLTKDGLGDWLPTWWSKYRVAQVTEHDLVGGTNDIVHAYSYATTGSSTAVLWHFDVGGRFSSGPEPRSWSDFRGWPLVTVTTGQTGTIQSQTAHLYFRGMDGDRTDAGDGTRTATITSSEGQVLTDAEPLRGFLRELLVYEKAGSPLAAATLYDPWQQQSALRTLPVTQASPSVQRATLVRTARTQSRTWVAVMGMWRRTDEQVTYDPTWGTPTQQHDYGDTNVATDDVCTTTTHVRNTTAWLVDFVSQVLTTNCAAAPTGTDYLTGTRTFFDGAASITADPTRGLPTRNESLASVSGTTLTWAPSGRTTFDPLGRMLDAFDAIDRKTTTAYTPVAGGPVTALTVTNPAGHVTSTTLEPAWGAPVTTTDPNLRVTTGAYDPLGRLVKVWRPGRQTSDTPDVEYVYNIRGTAAASSTTTKKLGPTGTQIVSHQVYDGMMRSRQVQSTAPDGKRVIDHTAYDTRGLVAKRATFYNGVSGPTDTVLSFADSSVPSLTKYLYDGQGRPTDAILLSSAVEKSRAVSDYDGDRTYLTPPTGGTVTKTLVDVQGRVTERRMYLGPAPSGPSDAVTYAYDRLGQLTTVTDTLGNHWDYTYDRRGRQTQAVDPDTGATTFTHDDAGQVLTSTDQRPVTLAYAYDSLGRRTGVFVNTTAGSKLAEWTYDTVAAGQLASSTRWVGTDAYVTAVTSYDNGYRPTGTSVTVPASETGLAGTYTFGATYNVDGSLATANLPGLGGLAAESLTYGYSAVTGLPTTMAGTSTYVDSTTYHFDNAVKERFLGTTSSRVRLTSTLDAATRRLAKAEVHTEHPGTPDTYDEKLTQEYAYQPAGSLSSVTEKQAGAVVSAQCFSYDYLRRLTEAWTKAVADCTGTPVAAGPDPYWTTWTYDATGNRMTQVVHGATTATTNYTYAAAGSAHPHAVTSATTTGGATATYTYDAKGNTTSRPDGGGQQTLAWDERGHLATVTQGSTNYSYLDDAEGNRLIARDPAGKTLYLPHGVELRYTTATGTTSCTRYYSHAGAVVGVRTPAGLNWLANDHHDTGEVTIDPSSLSVTRRKTTPFGEVRGTPPGSWSGDKGFVGGTQDPTGLVHLGAREYDPMIGRFVSVDPVGDHDDPQQVNGYSYANNNPTTMSDPTGLLVCLEQCGSTDDRQFQVALAAQRANELDKTRNTCYGGNQSASCRNAPMLPMISGRRSAPKNDQPEHRPYNSASSVERGARAQDIQAAIIEFEAMRQYMCAHGPTGCAQWNHWIEGTGSDLVVDPATFMSEKNFADDVNGILRFYRETAAAGCIASGSASCVYRFDSGWLDTLNTEKQPVSVDIAAMGQVQLNVSGTVAVVRNDDGSVSVSGTYQISIFKAWNFDPGEIPRPRGIPVPHLFYDLPAFGFGRDYVLRGTSSERRF